MTEPARPKAVPDSDRVPPGAAASAQPPGRAYRLASNPAVITAIWIVSAVLNVLFMASIVWLAVLYSSNSNALKNDNVSQCEQNNTGRQQDIAIWNLLLDQPRSKPLTPQQQQTFNTLKWLVKIKDTPRNCVKVYTP